MEKIFNQTFLLRLPVAVIMIMHSIPGMLDGSINGFGERYLNEVGFAPVGLYLAWAIKLSHVVCAVCMLIDKWLTPVSIVTILILVVGIVMVHWPDGWYVVGGGRNGIEFNFLMIFVLLALVFPKGFFHKA